MKNLILYRHVHVRGESFKTVKRSVIPKQSMSLREIVQRFIRRESLPALKEGFYDERFGDLEKMRNEDITQKYDRIDNLKATVKRGKKAEADKLQKAKDDAAKKVAESSIQSPAAAVSTGGGKKEVGVSPPTV